MATSIVTSVGLKSLPLVAEGKVREIYEASNDTLLLVTSDRISAYDVILENGVQDKGTVLTLLTNHWLNTVLPKHVPGLKHHLVSLNIPSSLDLSPEQRKTLRGRSMLVHKYRVFPIEAIGLTPTLSTPIAITRRRRLVGKMKTYAASRLSRITPDHARQIVGDRYADKIENLALAIYKAAHEYALEKGIIVADTKFEFGLDEETDEVVLIDEVLTPDSSRFWPAADYAPGRDQKSFDKQYLRDWLTGKYLGHDAVLILAELRIPTCEGLKGKEGVSMTEDVQARTSAKYLEAFQRLTGESLDQALAKLDN
ncbi:hypothetical protein NPX13_g789 [Xylaria arbuscula]|uniref:Phosphoribosylaminoimidazole-succinocarboxamide synthase n=1 Tax=Xylaria arbuscula TaxID=114810 RepID=A0A9W8TQT0_9PEZI|nr:hypothetical protein NPX13_g789 [Xylaria arbuscula]